MFVWMSAVFAMPLTVVKYIAVGWLIWLVGTLFFGSSIHFEGRSEPAQLRVVDIETRRDVDGQRQYRPVFALAGGRSTTQNHAGDEWYDIAPHQAGDLVSGRYDPQTGEMRSDQMQRTSLWLGRLAQIFGLLVGGQAIVIIFGLPERLLPFRIRIGGKRRPDQMLL